MNTIRKSLLIAFLLIISVSAQAGTSFWSGFGFGAASGIMGSTIAHGVSRPHCHVVYQAKPIEVRTVRYTPIHSTNTLRQELGAAEREIDALDAKNGRLEEALDQERASNRKERRKQQRTINELQDTIKDLEFSIKKLENRINQVK
jgi:flagellar motility protein MotE (MotC chaperone)